MFHIEELARLHNQKETDSAERSRVTALSGDPASEATRA